MKIKELHAHFLVSIGNYSNERIGFTVLLDENEIVEDVVAELRERAKKIVGPDNEQLFDKRSKLKSDCINLENKLEKLVKEWNDTANFLRVQGINPTAPPMPQFGNLLEAADKLESEYVAEFEDADNPGISDGF